VLALLGVVAGCSDGTGPVDTGPAGLRAIAGATGDDTISTMLTEALVVELRDANGRPLPGVAVRFEPESPSPQAPYAELAPLASQSFSPFRVDTTDTSGRVAMVVRLGLRAGAAAVRISAAQLGLETQATYTVRPGAPARVTLDPADTALYVGGAFALRGTVRDRQGNARPELPAFAAPPGVHPVATSGGSVQGERIGRGHVVATFGAIADTTWVSVVPRGVIAAYEPPIYVNSNGLEIIQPPRIVLLELDGSQVRVLLDQDPPQIPFAPGDGMLPRWAPSGDEIAYIHRGQVWAVDTSGATRRVHSGPPHVANNHSPEYSPDGQWIYVTQTSDSTGIWKARRDGSGVVKTAAQWPQAASPSPAPTGGRFVYHKPDQHLRILNEATGEDVTIPVIGQWPRWSPTGEWIAYLDRDLRLLVVRPDGTDLRLVGAGVGVKAYANFSWSPDGKWILYTAEQATAADPFRGAGLHLANVETGDVLPLRFTRRFYQGSWKP
jgi:hypothetical protein